MKFCRYAPLLRVIAILRAGIVNFCEDIKLRKPVTASDPTHCARAHDLSIRPIQVEVTLYLGQTDIGS